MNLIKELRETAGYSQRQLAAEVGVSRTKIYDLENDKAKLKDEELARLSKAFAKNIELAYVAGLFDRASHINITRIAPFKIHDNQASPMYISRVQFHTKHEMLANVVMDVFGTGKVCPVKEKGGRIKGYMYYAHCESVDKVIDLLLPYVRVKREKLLILKEFRAYLEYTRDEYRSINSAGWNSWLDKIVYDESKWLNMKEFCEAVGLGEQMIGLYLKEGRLKGKKVNVAGKKNQQWRIPSIYNLNEIRDLISAKKRRNPYPQEVLDRYEDFYNRIKK